MTGGGGSGGFDESLDDVFSTVFSGGAGAFPGMPEYRTSAATTTAATAAPPIQMPLPLRDGATSPAARSTRRAGAADFFAASFTGSSGLPMSFEKRFVM